MEPIRLAATFTLVSTWDVELSPTPTHYEMYYQNSWSAQEWTYWGDLSLPLDVREAAAALGDLYDDGLSGDWLSKISVTGQDGWRADVLRMAAITSDSPCSEHLDFLLQLSDEDIAWIWSRNGSLVTHAGLELVKALIHLAGVEVDSGELIELDRVLADADLDRNTDANAILAADDVRRKEERAAVERAAAPFQVEINRITSEFARLQGDRCSAISVSALKEALENYIAENGHLPDDTVRTSDGRNVNVRLLRYANVEDFIMQRAPSGPVPYDILSACTDFPPPTDSLLVVRLLREWCRCDKKAPARKQFGLGWHTPLGYLHWVLRGLTRDETVHLAHTFRDEWQSIQQWLEVQIDEINSALSAKRKPSNQAEAIVNGAKAKLVDWARQLIDDTRGVAR